LNLRRLAVDTYWRVTDRVQPPVTVFVHLLDQNGSIVGAERQLWRGDAHVGTGAISSCSGIR